MGKAKFVSSILDIFVCNQRIPLHFRNKFAHDSRQIFYTLCTPPFIIITFELYQLLVLLDNVRDLNENVIFGCMGQYATLSLSVYQNDVHAQYIQREDDSVYLFAIIDKKQIYSFQKVHETNFHLMQYLYFSNNHFWTEIITISHLYNGAVIDS